MKKKAFFSIPVALAIAFPGVSIARAATIEATEALTSSPWLTTEDSQSRNQVTEKPSFFIAQQSPPPQRLQFATGAIGTIVEGSVLRDSRKIYLLRVRGSQTMALDITSPEQNAVFDVQAPNGVYLTQEATSFRGELPQTGDYSIIVTGTRGNTSYILEVMVR